MRALPRQKRTERCDYHEIRKKTGGAAAAAMIAITVLANATPALANAMEQIPVIGSIAKVVTFRTYEDKKDNFEADIKVPQVTIEGTEGARCRPTNP